MNEKPAKLKDAAVDIVPEWHPYNVWQKLIKDAEAKPLEDDQNPTGSWRTDTVWQNLIKS